MISVNFGESEDMLTLLSLPDVTALCLEAKAGQSLEMECPNYHSIGQTTVHQIRSCRRQSRKNLRKGAIVLQSRNGMSKATKN